MYFSGGRREFEWWRELVSSSSSSSAARRPRVTPPSPPPANLHRSYPWRRGAARKLDIGGGGGGGRRRRIGVTCLDRFSQLVTRYGTSYGGDHTARGVMDPAFDLCPAIFSTEIADTWKFFSRKSMMVINASQYVPICSDFASSGAINGAMETYSVVDMHALRPVRLFSPLCKLYGISRLNTW